MIGSSGEDKPCAFLAVLSASAALDFPICRLIPPRRVPEGASRNRLARRSAGDHKLIPQRSVCVCVVCGGAGVEERERVSEEDTSAPVCSAHPRAGASLFTDVARRRGGIRILSHLEETFNHLSIIPA